MNQPVLEFKNVTWTYEDMDHPALRDVSFTVDPISHDEVVHMKGSVVGKMPGDYENQLRCTRGFYAYLKPSPKDLPAD